MGLIDVILNLAGLLLWLNWRSSRFDPLMQRTPATLVGTLKPLHSRRLRGWLLLTALGLMLVLRAALYWQIGSPANWTPKLDLFVVVLSFRNVLFSTVLLFSFLSFARTLIVFYFWLFVLVSITRNVSEPDPILRLFRTYLGRLGRGPWWVQIPAWCLFVALLWAALHPLLVRLEVSPRATSFLHLAEQGLLLGGMLPLTLKFLLPPFLLVYLVANYIYLGRSPLWEFVSTVSRQVLAPLRSVALQLGKLDVAPLGGVILLLLVLHVLPSVLRAKNLLPWPQ